jgi:hypothetical protein
VRIHQHHPTIAPCTDGSWVVDCAECRNSLTESIPIGIGMPLMERLTAERIAQNHVGHGSLATEEYPAPQRGARERSTVPSIPPRTPGGSASTAGARLIG